MASNAATVGTTIGEIVISDSNPSTTPTYSILSGRGVDSSSFAINSSTGALTVAQSLTSVTTSTRKTIQVSVTDDGSTITDYFHVNVLVSAEYGTHGVSYSRYSNSGSMAITDFTSLSIYPNSPSSRALLQQPVLENPTNTTTWCPVWLDGCGMRWTGYIVAPETGRYRFYLSTGYQGELRIGTGASALTLPSAPQAYRYYDDPQFATTDRHNYYYSSRATTMSIYMAKGQAYYFEGLGNSFGYAGHFAIAWKTPSGPTPVSQTTSASIPTTIIPAANLYPDVLANGTKAGMNAVDVVPSMPTYLTAETVANGSVTLAWNKSIGANGIANYSVSNDQGIIDTNVATGSGDIVKFTAMGQVGTRTYFVSAIDSTGRESDVARITVNADVAYNAVDAALVNGDAQLLTDPTNVINRAVSAIDSYPTTAQTMFDNMYAGVTSLTYTPSWMDVLIKPGTSGLGRVLPLVHPSACGNYCSSDIELGAFGYTPKSHPFVAVAARAWNDSGATGYQAALENTVSWLLTGRGDSAPVSTKRIAIFQDSTTPSATNVATKLKAWGWGSDATISLCTQANVETCARNVDLLIIGANNIADNLARWYTKIIRTADADGIPILYSENKQAPQNEAGKNAAQYLGFDQTYTNLLRSMSASYATSTDLAAMQTASIGPVFANVKTLLNHLKNKDWSVTLTGCSAYSCPSGMARTYLDNEFYAGARTLLQKTINAFDTGSIPLFNSSVTSQEVVKLAVLLGDIYRRFVKYPLNGNKAANLNPFLQSLYADHVVLNYRNVNPAQPDLGDFSSPISPIVQRYQDTVSFNTRPSDYFTGAGVYALPGESVTIQRTDTSGVRAQVFVNTLRPNSTQEFSNYLRPKYMTSAPNAILPPDLYMNGGITIDSGETVTLTNPYGGTVEVLIGTATTTKTVELTISNVGHHPAWRGDASTAAFEQAMANADYYWAEFLTPGFEVHSRLQYMAESMDDPRYNTTQKLSTAAIQNFYLTNYSLGGYTGSNLSLSSQISTLCTSKSWNCSDAQTHGIPGMNHFNADRGMCSVGSGCSGNPYDGTWSFAPTSWADAHEMGHNLQNMDLAGTDNSRVTKEVSNNIFPARVNYVWNKTHPSQMVGAPVGIDQAALYATLNNAQATPSTAIDTVASTLWYPDDGSSNYSYYEPSYKKLAFYLQLVEQSRMRLSSRLGNDGWDFVTGVYILDRIFVRNSWSSVSDTDWNAVKDSLCMGNYTRANAASTFGSGLGLNDKFLIEASCVTGLDQRPFFDMWGVKYSITASTQVNSLSYTPAAKEFFYWPVDKNNSVLWNSPTVGVVSVDGTAHTIPSVPISNVWTSGDTATATANVAAPLKAWTGAAGTVQFTVNGATITGCGAVTTQAYTNSQYEYFGVELATCNWTPPSNGTYDIRAVFTNASVGAPGNTSSAWSMTVGNGVSSTTTSTAPLSTTVAPSSSTTTPSTSTYSTTTTTTTPPPPVITQPAPSVATVSTKTIATWTAATVSAMAPETAATLSASQVAALKPAAVAGLQGEQLDAMPAKAIAAITPTQAKSLKPAAIANMGDAITQLAPKTLAALSTSALKAAKNNGFLDDLTAKQIGALKASQVKVLGLDKVKTLTAAQKKAVTAALKRK